jgi:hypothetical protein
MLFQSLDNKGKCVGIYHDGNLLFDSIPDSLSATWEYSQFLKNKDIEYAKLYCQGKNLAQVCPENLAEDLTAATKKLKAYLRSFQLGKISLNDHCFYDLVPEEFLLEYCHIKNKVTKHVLDTYEKPKNYDFLVDLTKLVADINCRKLDIDTSKLRDKYYSTNCRKFIRFINNLEPYCKYNIFGTKTGRLTNEAGSVPILTMPREYRVAINPTNDWFVEFDYNAAELRTVLSLSGKEQPSIDVHEWNAKNLFDGCSRDEAKKKIFAWMYNSKSKSKEAERVYKRSEIRAKYWDGEFVRTPYDRVIKADKHHSMSYIIQSTFSDLLLQQMIKVNKFLENRKSHIAFCVHDSIVLDMTEEEKYLIPEIKKMFSDTDLGNFKASVKAGKNFGKLYNLKL